MSRHTSISGKLSRSFGQDPETQEDWVVELRPGDVEFRREPTHRRIGRNEELPRLVLKVEDVMQSLHKKQDVAPQDHESLVDKLIKRLHVADLGIDEDPKLAYRIKVALLAELKKLSES